MLDKAGFPLSNTQISNFFLEQEYTDYFRVQEVIGELADSDLILTKTTHSNTQYSLTAAGKQTLSFFQDKITEGIVIDVKKFFEKNQLEFRQENSILGSSSWVCVCIHVPAVYTSLLSNLCRLSIYIVILLFHTSYF